jgi:tRNA/rRNA methyltransferase
MGRASKGRATGAVTPTIILVRPQLGENIGMAARAMLNCGLSTLRLVAPRDGWPNMKAQRAASGADIVLDQAEVFDTVAEAVADLEHVVATTARNRELSQRIVTPRHAAGEIGAWIGRGERVGILFGPERTGLTNDDMVQADTALSIPLNPQFSSLNVAQAVLLVAYEWAAKDEGQLGERQPAERMSDYATRPASKDELQNLFDHLERALDQSGFLRNKAMRPSMVQNLRAFLQRAGMTEQEVRSFHGVIKYLAKHKHSEE